jgi:DNA-directed RNA polymerase beta' subunit
MIYLLDLKKATAHLRPVTSTEYTVGKSNAFHPDGLFSEIIFGSKESPDRKKIFSYIDLYSKILHPALIKPIDRLNRKVVLAINREAAFTLDDKNFLVEDKDGEINSLTSVIKNFEKIFSRKEEVQIRIDMKNMVMTYFKRDLAFIDKCIVMPASFRDADTDEIHGGLRIPPINEYYLRIIRQSMQIQSLSVTSGPMYDILSTKMQQLVTELYDFLISKVSKKEGLVRQSILGKRADFTGRAVITGGAGKIKVDEIGIPFKVLVKLYEPFILYDLYNSGNVDRKKLEEELKTWDPISTLSIPAIRSLLTSIHKGFKIPLPLEDIVRSSVARAIVDKVVVAKRDPALHAESVQAFKPVLVDGDTIQLSIAKCAAYNADFDGDAMAIYVPVTKEAIQEAREKMITSESKDSIDMIGDDFSKDIVAGIYALTQDSPSKKAPMILKSDDELQMLHPLDIIKYDGEITTVGRVLFNKILPSKKYYINRSINKSDVKKLVQQIYMEYGLTTKDKYVEFTNNLVNLGVKYFTIMAPSFSLDDLMNIPPHLLELKKHLSEAKTPEDADRIMKQIEKELQLYTEKNKTNIGILGASGALKGGYGQSTQILVAKGLIQGPEEVKVFSKSYADGLNSDEYFQSGYGSRQGIVDRVINTSATGYLSRQLVFALQRVEADPRIKDCRTKRFLTLKVTPDIAKRLKGRYLVSNKGDLVLFDKSKHLGKVVSLRSPLYCISPSICRTCYGDLLLRNKTKYVGILAGEICGERLTQTIMRTFHVGGSISMRSIDILQEISRIMSDADRHFLIDSFRQEKSKFISNVDGEIEIDISEYEDPHTDIIQTSEKLNLNYAYFKIKYLSYTTEVTIDNKIEILLKDKQFNESEGVIRIKFPKNSIVFDCLPTAEIFSEKVKIIEAILSGRTPWRNADHFCMKIYDIYSTLSTDADMVHFEILASNLLRDAGNPSYPARLNKNYNPVVGSLKSVPGLESWLQAFAFENPKQAITNGLIYDRPTDETILEKIITGNF